MHCGHHFNVLANFGSPDFGFKISVQLIEILLRVYFCYVDGVNSASREVITAEGSQPTNSAKIAAKLKFLCAVQCGAVRYPGKLVRSIHRYSLLCPTKAAWHHKALSIECTDDKRLSIECNQSSSILANLSLYHYQ